MLGGLFHHSEASFDVLEWNVPMKKVAHRIYENHARRSPVKWGFEHIWLQGELECVPVSVLPHGL
jgi:hypothetical protein